MVHIVYNSLRVEHTLIAVSITIILMWPTECFDVFIRLSQYPSCASVKLYSDTGYPKQPLTTSGPVTEHQHDCQIK